MGSSPSDTIPALLRDARLTRAERQVSHLRLVAIAIALEANKDKFGQFDCSAAKLKELVPDTKFAATKVLRELRRLAVVETHKSSGYYIYTITASGERRADTEVIEDLFAYWVKACGKPERTQLTNPRRDCLVRSLRHSKPAEIRLAIDAIAKSEFHNGLNEQKAKYNDLTLICRDRQHIEKYIDMGERQNGSHDVAATPIPEGPTWKR